MMSRVVCLIGSETTCQKHRDRILRETQALFEIEFDPHGSTDEIVPTVRKQRSWFTMYWKSPEALKEEEKSAWVSQGRGLGQMIRGAERLPRMPKGIRGLTQQGTRDKIQWELDGYGYVKVYLSTVGEEVVILKDSEVDTPQGYAPGVPRFTLDELLRLRHFVGMKPNPEMIQGVWLLKKHLNASVLR